MNKAELIAEMAFRTGRTKKQETESLEALIDIIHEELSNKRYVRLVGFGTFETRERKAKIELTRKILQKRLKFLQRLFPYLNLVKSSKKMLMENNINLIEQLSKLRELFLFIIQNKH